MRADLRLPLLGLLLFAAVLVAGYRLAPGLLTPAAGVEGVVDPTCDLQIQACVATFADGGRLSLSLLPQPIPLMQPLQVEVRLEGFAGNAVELDFSGADMVMGLNRVPLAGMGGGRFTGQAVLPLCATGAMDWLTSVLVTSQQSSRSARFRFSSAGVRK